MIEAQHINKSFGNKKAVKDLSFHIKKGEIFVLLGTSGCGKTTTLKMINRLLEADSGEIIINNKNIKDHSPVNLRRNIGYVMQKIGLFPHYTIQENIATVPNLLKWNKEKTNKRARELLQKFNLSPNSYFNSYPHQLSGGEQQRIGFVRALVANPPVLLMDEPMGALDPITRKQIGREFKQLDELKGKTIVLVTHDISEAIELGDRICLMDEGREQQTATPTELLLHPKNDFVRNFFSHEQFIYQLKALKVKDLIPYLSPIEKPKENALSIDTEDTILDAFETLSIFKTGEKQGFVFDKKSKQYFSIRLNELLNAFNQKTGNAK